MTFPQQKSIKKTAHRLTSTLWLNWVVVGFSKRFLYQGDMAQRSDGIQRSAIFGNELYVSPASRPATKAPERRPNAIHLQTFSFWGQKNETWTTKFWEGTVSLWPRQGYYASGCKQIDDWLTWQGSEKRQRKNAMGIHFEFRKLRCNSCHLQTENKTLETKSSETVDQEKALHLRWRKNDNSRIRRGK